MVPLGWQHPRYENLKGREILAHLTVEDIQNLQPEVKDVGYCLYESTSLGTPLTPVFGSNDDLMKHVAEHRVPVVGDRWAFNQTEWDAYLEEQNG